MGLLRGGIMPGPVNRLNCGHLPSEQPAQKKAWF